MLQIQDGQCGMCKHFGEHDEQHQQQLVELRTSHIAPEDMTEECGHPNLVPLHLIVTPVASCNGFERADN